MEIKVVNPGQGSGGELSGDCPHCKKPVVFTTVNANAIHDLHITPFWLGHRKCPNPECLKHVFVIAQDHKLVKSYPEVPPEKPRPELDKTVTAPYRNDYEEAAAVLAISPKASAAVSRRLLQHVIREKAGITKANLSLEIDDLLTAGGLPAHVNEAVDAVRVIGNFAAHPTKAINTGEIIEVEPGEAEWNLDVLDMLFDFYFVQPERLKARKDALNMKLQAAGKPLLK